MEHIKYQSTKTLVENNIPVLLFGPAGTGKTTIAMHIAKDLDLPFYSLSMTKQTTVNAIIGFISINGTYIPSQFRQAFENGGVFLLDEIDAADPNTILCLNTIENGYVAFPDGVVQKHPNFRLIATANPIDSSMYTGRNRLDKATTDRFMKVNIDIDTSLEEDLTSKESVSVINMARGIMEDYGYTDNISTRDLIRYHNISKLGIYEDTLEVIVDSPDVYKHIKDKVQTAQEEARKASMTQADATTIDELWEIIVKESNENK